MVNRASAMPEFCLQTLRLGEQCNSINLLYDHDLCRVYVRLSSWPKSDISMKCVILQLAGRVATVGGALQ